ncbi:hypothetical protein ABPG77_002761 [Micractinium sp. CCAP 211/92]
MHSGRVLLEQPAAAATARSSKRSLTIAAANRPQQQRPGEPSRQQQDPSHQHAFDTIRREWHVRRTELRHFPEEVQQRIKASSPGIVNGSAGGRAAAGSQRPSAPTASGWPRRSQGSAAGSAAGSGVTAAADAGSGRAGQATLAADLQKLLAALEYERRTGFGNVVGSIERVPVADWASRQLLNAAGQLQAEPSAAHACVAAAQRLRLYAEAATAERQAAVAAAEAAAQAALQAAQAVPMAPAGAVSAAAAATETPGSATETPGSAGSAVPDHELDAAAEEAHAEESGQQRPTPEGEEYVMQGNRRVKASTVAFRRSKAIGLFADDRQQLWGEKVGMVEPFAGNAATAWGTSAEPKALEEYRAVTGQRIASCMFQVRHDDTVHGWLGASPDGLIESLALDPPASAGAGDAAAADNGGSSPSSGGGWQQARPVRGAGLLVGPGRGILEIKCPYNRGQPEQAVPPPHAIWYYMPQVQGLMYIFDCEWCNLYIWTPKRGSAVYHIRRDRQYWGQLWSVLAEFWWNHVVPARQEFQAGRWEEVEQYRPSPKIQATELLRDWSKRMALEAPATFFGPQPQSSGSSRQ